MVCWSNWGSFEKLRIFIAEFCLFVVVLFALHKDPPRPKTAPGISIFCKKWILLCCFPRYHPGSPPPAPAVSQIQREKLKSRKDQRERDKEPNKSKVGKQRFSSCKIIPISLQSQILIEHLLTHDLS